VVIMRSGKFSFAGEIEQWKNNSLWREHSIVNGR
jgi:hypothetical protein